MNDLTLRTMTYRDRAEVAELIYLSTNHWYIASGKQPVFTGDPRACAVFCETYEALDPGCCLLVENADTGRIVGSCFYHPRPTHVSIGIVNVHPNYFGRGIARQMLDQVIKIAEDAGKPLRLVSSAMNLDSFSLYTRAGFVPRIAFQDMYIHVPTTGLQYPGLPHSESVRPATEADVAPMAALEQEQVGIQREDDYRYFLNNADGIWSASVCEGANGVLDGFLVSVAHPASNMLGPGVARTESVAAALICAELDRHRGRTPVFLVPVQASELVQTMYRLGAKNCEMHFLQVRGDFPAPRGIILPTFLPETG